MVEYIKQSDAVVVADYAADEHPYDKNPEKPETYSNYNEGWNDACDYIREKLEAVNPSEVAPVVRCKNCVFYRKTKDWDGNAYYACHKRASVLIMEMKPDDYCSYGERRQENA